MKTTIRFVLVLAVAVVAFSVLPAFADTDNYTPGLKVANQLQLRILTLDRKGVPERPVPLPIDNPKPEDPPTLAASGPSRGDTSTTTTGLAAPSTLGSFGLGVSSKSQIVERSLRSVADRLR